MAAIWAAEDSLLRRDVAVKVLAEQFAAQPRFVERFEREAPDCGAMQCAAMVAGGGEHALDLVVLALLQHDFELVLAALGDGEASAAEVGERVGISRATAQRHLAALAARTVVEVSLRYGATGRPEHRYAART